MAVKTCLCSRDLNRRVTVEQLAGTADESGQIDEMDDANWRQVAKRWCQMLTRGSREFFRGEQIAADITHQVTLRYDQQAKNFTTKMRLRMGDRKFNIAGPPVNVDEQNLWLVFATTEVK